MSFAIMIFLIVILGLAPVEQRHGYSALLTIPLAFMLLVGALSLLFDRPQNEDANTQEASGVSPQRCSCDCVWASGCFADVEFGDVDSTTPLEFHHIHVEKGIGGAEWQQAGPVSVKSDLCVIKPTCACCLDDFQAASIIAVLPCGHVFHEDCIAHWSLAASKSANSCPTCRTSFERVTASQCKPA